MKKVTLDTNIFPADDIVKLCREKSMDIKIVTVTGRELNQSNIKTNIQPLSETGVWGESLWGQAVYGHEKTILESFVLNETPLGSGRLGSYSSEEAFELILKIISNGSFPQKGKREDLNNGERNQLRDAMIFEAHVREKRNIFVTDDKSAFIGDEGKIRSSLQKLFNTKILTRKEFLEHCEQTGSHQGD